MTLTVSGTAPILARARVRVGAMPTVVLVAHDVDEVRGMEHTMASLLRHGAGDWDFVVVSSTLAPSLREYARWVPVRVPRRPVPLKFACFWVAAGLSLRRVRGDLVHAAGAVVPGRVDLATVHLSHVGLRRADPWVAGAPVVRRLNSLVARGLAELAERWSYRPGRVRLLAAVSDGLAEELRRDFHGVPVVVTPNAVDASVYRPDPDARARVRRELGADDDEVVVLFAGGDWHRKGLGLLAAAAREARVTLWVAGEGDPASVPAGPRFLGQRSDLPALMAAADVFALPSAYETFSLVCHEAAACGLPVVATPVHGVASLVGSDGGVLVSRSVASVADALRRLAADPGLRRAMGERARARAVDFTWESAYLSTDSAYRSLLSLPRPTMNGP
jgi:UDP-glucose:(heptosyl)LPS alpha-1,3-glucosyltransferase